MLQLVWLKIILLTIFTLRSAGIRIRGSSRYTYDPRNPGAGFRLTCEQDNGLSITSASWTRNGVPVNTTLVQGNGRLALNNYTTGTDDPQSFEGLYRCHSGGDTSDPVAFFGKTNSVFLNMTTLIINTSYSGTKAQ